MMAFILVVHIIACILLVVFVLMQAGRGGGLAESFSSAESMFGTQANKLMVRITSVVATIFLVTSLTLAFFSSKADKSLMANKALLPPPAAVPAATEPEALEPTITIQEPKPIEANAIVEDANVTPVSAPVQ
jgi:preprotein translocase subunit SecG